MSPISIDLAGRTALVTGGGIGIGKSIALMLAEAGADVAVTYQSNDGEKVAETIRQLGRQSAAYRLDAASSAEVNHAVTEAASALGGRIDILVNNAGGLIATREVAAMDDELWHRVIDVNLSSAFYCSRAVLPHMPDGGRIVCVSSLAARNGGAPGSIAYATAKAGLLGFVRGLAKEVGPQGITVNAIAPGLILDTPFHATFTSEERQKATIAATPLRRPGYPVDCAGAVLYLVSDLASFATGAIVDLNGGTYFG
jgi:3-oxoacyl-[acyl-carrier protein] reductase